jgi:hypothetical protein
MFKCQPSYGQGESWAEAIESIGEQIRRMWWMEKERQNGLG